MSKRASSEELDLLHATVAQALSDAIRSGEAPAAMVAVAVKFLKDNDITALPSSPRLQELANAAAGLPEFDDEEGFDLHRMQ